MSTVLQRKTSLPSKRTGGRKEARKVIPRVSFSLLPPIQITFFESDSDSSDEWEIRKATFNSRVSQFFYENDRERCSLKYHQCMSNQETTVGATDTPENVNELDCANEMLMDIMEEIEADNISVDGCLRDAITLNLINLQDARNVLDDFDVEIAKDVNNNFSSSKSVGDMKENDYEQSDTPTDKLIDLLSTFKTADLTKCCRHTLGKLCQLTSFEDYETVQKQFSHTLISRITSDEDSTTSEILDDSSVTDPTEISSSSTDTLDDSSGIGSEIDFQCGTNLNSTLEPKQNANRNSTIAAVKQALPALIDGGVLKPIQVWGIIGSKDDEELLNRFSKEISVSLKISSPNINSSQKNPFQQRNYACRGHDEAAIADLGYCSYQSELDSPTSSETHLSAGKNMDSNNVIKTRPFTITSARSSSLKLNVRSSISVVNQNHRRMGRRSSEIDSFTCKGKCLHRIL